jgi:RNA polymerase sigma factor (sigma-70 family)
LKRNSTTRNNADQLEKQTFKQLFEKHFEEIRRYLFFRCGDEELATDLAQDTFLRLWEKQSDIHMETIRGLLYKIAGDLFVTKYRREKSKFNFFNNYTPEVYERSADEELTYQEMLATYEKALETMGEKQRTVFLMSRIEELKYQEIADRLELSVKAVEKRMSQALSHLRQALKGYGNQAILLVIQLTQQLKTRMNK